MDFPDLFDRQGRLMDDMLMAAFQVPPERFTAAGPEGGPSLRDLLLEWLDTQRRVVQTVLQDRAHYPLRPEAHPTVQSLGQAFGGFRLTLRELLDDLTQETVDRKVPWTEASGAVREVTVDEVLVHLVLHDARMQGQVAERLRQLGAAPPRVDLLA
jgi:uncharacterized damage-inducible protein DinB